jgi:hypothetical protein
MRRTCLKIFSIAVWMNLAAYGQSLGEIARENREKQKTGETSRVPPRMITNKDLPADPEGYERPREAQSGAAVVNTAADQRSAQQHSEQQRSAQQSSEQQRSWEQRAAGQWKRQIATQENRMADLQARIDQLNASLHYPGRSGPYGGPSNRYEARQLERVDQMQQRLEEQKRILEQMQEAARHAGMHTNVYEP